MKSTGEVWDILVHQRPLERQPDYRGSVSFSDAGGRVWGNATGTLAQNHDHGSPGLDGIRFGDGSIVEPHLHLRQCFPNRDGVEGDCVASPLLLPENADLICNSDPCLVMFRIILDCTLDEDRAYRAAKS